MRTSSDDDFDGPANILNSVKVAVSHAARGLGVLAVFGDHAHSARHVMKLHTTAVPAFGSLSAGPVGLVDGDAFEVLWRPAPTPVLPVANPAEQVYLVKMAAGMDHLPLSLLLETRPRGVVIEGSGAGNVYSEWTTAIAGAQAQNIPVVLVSRVIDGPVVPLYGGAGGGQSLRELGVIPGGDLSGQKARIALIFALGAGLSIEEIRDFFDHLTGGASETLPVESSKVGDAKL
jgi:L-asparaginase